MKRQQIVDPPESTARFRRAIRLHPRRGMPSNWSQLDPIPWNPAGRFTGDHDDPGGFLDYHTGCIYPQDAASQVPVLLLNPQPGETIVDTCAAPGSKSTQIGLAMGDDGLLVCCDAAAPRRQALSENLARQGISCAVVTPMPLEMLAQKHPAVADGVLVDAPCSGHELRSPKQVARMAERQTSILFQAAKLVRPNGRLVYSTCTPYHAENEGVIATFLAAHPGWRVEATSLPGCSGDEAGLGAIRLSPEHQGTEPFFACKLRAPDHERFGDSLAGNLPPSNGAIAPWLPDSPLHTWRRGKAWFAASRAAASCALPSEARGILLGHGDELKLEPWAAQAIIERGATATVVTHERAGAMWAGIEIATDVPDGLVRTATGAPLGLLCQGRLMIPSRMRRSGLR